MPPHEAQKHILLGFVGQGWVGRNYADHFLDRGFSVVRYALEEPYASNRERIAECDVVFIAVPTPTTPEGIELSNVVDAIALVGRGKVAVVKSTIPPGTTEKLAEEFSDRYVFHSPEFLREATARADVDHPLRVLVGTPSNSTEYVTRANLVLALHGEVAHREVVPAREAELIKYAHNSLGFTLIVYANILYDLAKVHGVEWEKVRRSILENQWYPEKYIDPVHKGGRGAGGHCFIKDFAALRTHYEELCPDDKEGAKLLRAFEEKNIALLRATGKDQMLVEGVYGTVRK